MDKVQIKGVSSLEESRRFHVLHDEKEGCTVVYDAQTEELKKPSCWQDMNAYYHYLMHRQRHHEAQTMLAEFMAGGTPITRLVKAVKCDGSSTGKMPSYA